MSVEPLSHLFVTELLNALDDIQQDIPIILDAYLEGQLPTELDIDVDILATSLTNLRDSARLTRSVLEINRIDEQDADTEPIIDFSKYRSLGLALFLHIHMLTDDTSIYYNECFNDPFNDVAGLVQFDLAN